jgi:hypothetical protein
MLALMLCPAPVAEKPVEASRFIRSISVLNSRIFSVKPPSSLAALWILGTIAISAAVMPMISVALNATFATC